MEKPQDPEHLQETEVSPSEPSAPSADDDGRRQDNIESLKAAATRAARAEPRDRGQIVVLSTRSEKERMPGWLLPVVLGVFAVLTVLNLVGLGLFRVEAPMETEAEAGAAVAQMVETEAMWVESYLEAYGKLPVDGKNFDLDGLGHLVPLGAGHFRLTLQEPDGWSGVYDSKTKKVSVSHTQ